MMVAAQRMADIAIVGAGLVGVPLAHVLAAKGWQIVLLDAADERSASGMSGNGTAGNPGDEQRATDRPGLHTGDPAVEPARAVPDDALDLQQRCTALNLGTQQWLEQHTLWPPVAVDAAAIRHVIVSHKGYFGTTRLHAHELDAQALGYVVNNDHMVSALLARLADTTVDHRRSARVVSVEHQQRHVVVHLADGSSVCARLLIAADGVSSVVRESVGIGTTQVDYQQAAVLCTIRLCGSHEGVAHERFTASGPLALLPRHGACMSVVDCIEPGERRLIALLDEQAYLARLQSRFGYRLGRFAAAGPRLVVPLVRIEATSQTASRIVLLGNAVRLLHPVGGQGYNLAMRDVAALVNVLDQPPGSDPGDAALLQRFAGERKADQRQIVRFTDALARGFRGRTALPGHVRAAALVGLDTVSPLRRQFARRTMGLIS